MQRLTALTRAARFEQAFDLAVGDDWIVIERRQPVVRIERAGDRATQLAHQLFNAPTGAPINGDDRRAERLRELRRVDGMARLREQVHHRQRDDERLALLGDISGELQVAFELCGVNYNDERIGRDRTVTAFDDLARERLFGCGGGSAVDAGQVNDCRLRA